MNIQKVKLIKGGALEVEYINENGDTIKHKGENIVHADLKDAMAKLVPFFVKMCEMPETIQLSDDLTAEQEVDLSKIRVSSVQTKGSIIIIGGSRILQNNKVLSLYTPSYSTDDDMDDWMSDLEACCHAVTEEARMYVEEKKWGFVQTEMNLNATDEDPFNEEE